MGHGAHCAGERRFPRRPAPLRFYPPSSGTCSAGRGFAHRARAAFLEISRRRSAVSLCGARRAALEAAELAERDGRQVLGRALESLLDGIESAFRYYGGLVDRVVLDNTSLAVKDVLAGRDRVETEAFEAFRGGYPFRAEFCAPAEGLGALRTPEPGGDDESAVRALVRGLPRPDGGCRGHRPGRAPRDRTADHGRQLQVGSREAEPGAGGR